MLMRDLVEGVWVGWIVRDHMGRALLVGVNTKADQTKPNQKFGFTEDLIW